MRKLLAGLMALLPISAFANPACPVCTVLIVGSVGVAQSYDISPAVVGLWAGAMLVLLGYWLLKFMDKKNWHFWGRDILVLTLSVATIVFVYMGGVEYKPDSVCGWFNMDPILFGTICGALIFVGTSKLYEWMKKKNNGHAHFPFEKVVLPIAALALTSWLFTLCL